MPYNTVQEVRDDLRTDEISDTKLTNLRKKGEKRLIRDITIKVDEKDLESNLEGNKLDGSNSTFYTNESVTQDYVIADTNRDSTVDSSDVTVWVWSEADQRGTRSEATISSVEAKSGKIKLDSPPSSTNDRITASYSYYLSETLPEWGLVSLAGAYITGHLAMIYLRGKQPVRYSIGDFDYRDDDPGRVFLREYSSTINDIRDKSSVT